MTITEYLGGIPLGEHLIAEIPASAVKLISGTTYSEYMDNYPFQAYVHPVDLDAVTFRSPTEEEIRIVENKENPDLHYLF